MLKVKKFIKRSGFTQEQQKYIADAVLTEINRNGNIDLLTNLIKNDYADDFKKANGKRSFNIKKTYAEGVPDDVPEIYINVINCTCKYRLINKFDVLIKFLEKCGITLTAGTVVNPIYAKLKSFGKLIETPDGFSDGAILLSKQYVGEVPNDDTFKTDTTFKDLCPADNKLIKLENTGYICAKNQKHAHIKNIKFCIFYKSKKNPDFVVFDQKYINMLPKNCEIFLETGTKFKKLVAKQNGEFIALIMPMDIKSLNEFELLPDIETESESETKKSNIVEFPPVLYKNPKEHKNAVTEHIYAGNNIDLLNAAMLQNGYAAPVWVGKYQARKLNKQIKQNAPGVVIKVFYEDVDGRAFCKMETVFNIAELEAIQKIENTSDYKNIVERLKMA